MPLYDLRCSKCKRVEERLMAYSESTPKCGCGGEMDKIMANNLPNFYLSGPHFVNIGMSGKGVWGARTDKK